MRTVITDENIKDLVKFYIEDKTQLPEDLQDKPIGEWVVKRVTDMSELFKNRSTFNEDINNWNVSNVTNMFKMFSGCTAFNQPLDEWNVRKVENMQEMFLGCREFDQPLFKNVKNVEQMFGMFSGCVEFNQDLSKWNISNVKDMGHMFEDCYNLKDVPVWTPTKGTNVDFMFRGTDFAGLIPQEVLRSRKTSDSRKTRKTPSRSPVKPQPKFPLASSIAWPSEFKRRQAMIQKGFEGGKNKTQRRKTQKR
jgi:surface protein